MYHLHIGDMRCLMTSVAQHCVLHLSEMPLAHTRCSTILRLTACMALFAFHAYSLSEAILFNNITDFCKIFSVKVENCNLALSKNASRVYISAVKG